VVRLENASAASQAVGPTLSGFEMSCADRGFRDVGKKLLARKPLGLQKIAPDDSVLGLLRDPAGLGLARSYADLIQQAFDPKYWASTEAWDGFTQMESNFSLFWGLAIMLYEDTLLSDDAPIDHFLDGDASALTPQQRFGKALFEGQAQCVNCHHGANHERAAFDPRLGALRGDHRGELDRADADGQRQVRALRQRVLQHRRPSHRRGSRRGRQGSIRQSVVEVRPR